MCSHLKDCQSATTGAGATGTINPTVIESGFFCGMNKTPPKRWTAHTLALLAAVMITLLSAAAVPLEAAVIRNFRVGDQKGYIRLVLESDRPMPAVPTVVMDKNRMHITLDGIINTISTPPEDTLTADIAAIDISGVSGKPAIDVAFTFTPANVQTFVLTGPHRFIIDVYRPAPGTAGDQHPISDAESSTSTAMPEPYVVPSGNGIAAPAPPERLKQSPDSENRHVQGRPFRQRILAALIVVTSIIAVLLLLLIWFGGKRDVDRSSWQEVLPPESDADIENLDARIRE